MPSHQEHCNDSYKRYGYNFSEVHRWMDEPSGTELGPNHRKYRHNPHVTPKKAEEIFWNDVPEQYRKFITDAVLDHILLDGYEDKRIDKKKLSELISEMEKCNCFENKIDINEKDKIVKEFIRIIKEEDNYNDFILKYKTTEKMEEIIPFDNDEWIKIFKSRPDEISIEISSSNRIFTISPDELKEVSDVLLEIYNKNIEKSNNNFYPKDYDIIYEVLKGLKSYKLISINNTSLRLTNRGIDFLNCEKKDYYIAKISIEDKCKSINKIVVKNCINKFIDATPTERKLIKKIANDEKNATEDDLYNFYDFYKSRNFEYVFIKKRIGNIALANISISNLRKVLKEI